MRAGVAQILNRAIALYVGNFAILICISLVVVAPLTVIQAVMFGGSDLSAALAQMQNPHADPRASTAIFGRVMAPVFAVAGLVFLLRPFELVAVSAVAQKSENNERPSFVQAYAAALRRLPSILGLIFLLVLAMAVFLVAFSIVFSLLLIAIAVAVHGQTLTGVASIFVAFCVAAGIAFFFLSYVAGAVAFNTAGLENAGALQALGMAAARVFNRSEMRRAASIAFIIATIMIALELVVGALGLPAKSSTRSLTLYFVAAGIFAVVTESFTAVVLSVYYLTVREAEAAVPIAS